MPPRPTGPLLSQRLRSLALSLPPATALFYARLYYAFFPPVAESSEHDSLHILALCLLQAGQAYPALHLVRDLADADADPGDDVPDYENGIPARRPGCYGCAIIVAKCCNPLSRFSEGQAVLERAVRRSLPMSLPTPTPTDTAATTSLLLATLSHKGKASAPAVAYYTRALSEDPWLWEAFTGLCDIGAPPPLESIFPDPPSTSRPTSHRTSRHPTLSPNPMPRSSACEVPNFLNRRQPGIVPLAGTGSGNLFTPEPSAQPQRLGIGMMGNPSQWDTPSMMQDSTFPAIEHNAPGSPRRPIPSLISSILPSAASSILPAALRSTPNPTNDLPARPPATKRQRGPTRKPTLETPTGGPLSVESRLNGRDHKPVSLEINGDNKMLEPPVRRSSRLNSASGKAASRAREKRAVRSTSVASSGSGHTESASPASLEAQAQIAVDDWIRDILRRCARAYRYFSLYRCQQALVELDGLPAEMSTCPWALDLVARCFYEMAEYVKARRAFQALLEVDPYRLESMELYSTLLWHLGDGPALSHLSQVLVSVDREAPQPWIAAGNSFSLQRDHEEAMRCFRRATQLAPSCAYAWALCGFEAAEMEEHERAIAFFRTAIRANPRHYNAWYHMGTVYLAQGKIRHAEHHFRRAAEINPSSPVLLCCIGDVLERSDNLPGALAVYERALELARHAQSEAVMVQFKRVRLLVQLGRIAEAISALEPLAVRASDEANVHFLLGKCYMRVGRNADAMVAFTTARELNPKLEGAIRAAVAAKGGEVETEEE